MSEELMKPDIMTLGAVFARSGYFQDARDAAQAVVKMLAGQELGFGPVASMTGIYIVKGRVSLSANLIAAAVKKGGKYNYRVAHLDDDSCTIVFYEGKEEIGKSEFTMAQATKAGLVNENYRKFARNMLFARAMSNGAKWFCADVFGGPAYTPDELGATVDMETGEMLQRPDDEPPASVTHAISGPPISPTTGVTTVLDETVDEQGDRLFPSLEDERVQKNALMGAILAGKAKLGLSDAEFQATWIKHLACKYDDAMDVGELDRTLMESLRDALRARYRAQAARAAKQ